MTKLILNGVDVDELFPGFRFRSEGNNERMFAREGETPISIIQVFGKMEIRGTGKEAHWHSDIVATLRDEDCELYFLLGWKDKFRNHPDVGMANGLMMLQNFLLLFLANLFLFGFLVHVFWSPESELTIAAGLVSVLVSALVGAFVELSAWHELVTYAKRIHAERKIDHWVALHPRDEHDVVLLLASLTHASDKDVADEATRALARY